MPTNPGIHAFVTFDAFDPSEIRTAVALSSCFYITNARIIEPTRTQYKYLLMRPAENIAHAIPNAREIVFLFSPYENFEARSLDAYHYIQEEFESHRINTHFRMLCSMDKNILLKMQKLCVDEPDLPVTLPFLYNQIQDVNARSVIIKSARESYYFRDLFAQKSPLQNDTYFFGRREFLAKIRDRMSRAENSGVFGLRKSGKTSILLAAQRSARADGHRFLLVDCQSPTSHVGGWNDLLRLVVIGLRKNAGLSTTPNAVGDFTEKYASENFEKNLNEIFSSGKRIIVIAFDEIEHISEGSGAPAWRDGENALFFWQTLRSVQQRFPGRLSFIVAGTNPKITESRHLAGADNPLLEYIHADYLGGLGDKELMRMCQEIGGLMGMDLEVQAISLLYRTLGGHPYLTRQVCSQIHQNLNKEGRPCRVTANDVSDVLKSFDFSPLLEDVLGSLRERYPDEYACLEWVALDDLDQVQYFLNEDPSFVRHLQGYGLIDVVAGVVRPRLELALSYLRTKSKQSDLIRSPEERWAAIASRRGAVEVKLRELLKGRLIDIFGRSGAVEGLREWLTIRRSADLINCGIEATFSKQDCKLYFSDIIQSVRKDIDWWSRRLDRDAAELLGLLDLINSFRHDAHAREISNSDFDNLLKALAVCEEA